MTRADDPWNYSVPYSYWHYHCYYNTIGIGIIFAVITIMNMLNILDYLVNHQPAY